MRLKWAKTLMIGQCFACFLAAFWFYIYISSVHVIIYKNVVPACLQNTSRLAMCQLLFFAKFASGWLLARCKFHSVSCQPDANFIQLAAIRMQISFSRRQPYANCIRLAAMQYKYPDCMRLVTNQMKFASCWRLAECKFCRNKRPAHR